MFSDNDIVKCIVIVHDIMNWLVKRAPQVRLEMWESCDFFGLQGDQCVAVLNEKNGHHVGPTSIFA